MIDEHVGILDVELDCQPWSLTKIVLPQHTDHAGVMWHGTYVNWLEEARITALNEVGLPYKALFERNLEMPVINIHIDYRKSLFHGDEVVLESWSLPSTGVRWPWLTTFFRDGREAVAKARIELVLINFIGGNRKVLREVPEDLCKTFIDLQKGP